MAHAAIAAGVAEPGARPPSTIGARRLGRPQRRALVSYFAALVVWQLGSTSGRWLGFELPLWGRIPAPSDVFAAWSHLLLDPGYWQSWLASWKRVATGFCAAVITGVPLGLVMALNQPIWDVVFPVFELLRPIPPLAWVPVAILFWPTQELSIDAVIFIGAFYTLVLNAVSGARSIDPRFIQVARSMGASRRNILSQLVLPGVLPSVLVGMEVSIGITWEVVVAAEMISGGGSSRAASSGGGLGFFIWNSYVGGCYPQIIVGMISIGIAGSLSSAALRALAARLLRWNAPALGGT